MQLLGIELHLWPMTTVGRSEKNIKTARLLPVIFTSGRVPELLRLHVEAGHGVRGEESPPGGPADSRDPGEEVRLELGHNSRAAPGGLVGRTTPTRHGGDQAVITAPAPTHSTTSTTSTSTTSTTSTTTSSTLV